MSGNNGNINLFVITSVIFFNKSPLNYSAERSVFTPKQRAEQTLETINSIRKFSKSSCIVLIESGLKKDIDSKIINSVDQFIYTGDNFFVRKFTDGPKKGLGECVSLAKGLKKITIKEYDYIYKISGRYKLNKTYNSSKFNVSYDFAFKKYTNPPQVSTRLYGISPHAFDKWRKALKTSIPRLFFGRSIEQMLYDKTKKLNNYYMTHLGVNGLIGPDGSSISE